MSLQQQVSIISESSREEMDLTENGSEKLSDNEIENMEERDEDLLGDKDDPDWSVMEENGEEYPSDDDEENDNETNSYVRCVRCQSFLGTVVGKTNGSQIWVSH